MQYTSVEVNENNCPLDCPLISFCIYTPYCNSTYKRYRGSKGEQEVVQWGCSAGYLWTVIADDMLPYLRVTTDVLEVHFDALSLANVRAPPEADDEIEKGCLWRAWKRFGLRFKDLTEELGQLLPLVFSPEELWIEMRKHIPPQPTNLSMILLYLKEKIKTSLLGVYKCLDSCW